MELGAERMTSSTDDTATEPVGVVDDGDVMDADWVEEPRRTGTLTRVLVGLLLVALGFLGGVTVGRSAGGAAPTGGSTSGSSGGGGGAATGGSTGGGAGAGGSGANSGTGSSVAPSAANAPGGASPRTSVVAPPTVVESRTQQQPAPAGSPAVGGLVPTVGAQPTATANSGGAGVGSTGPGSTPTSVNGTG
jgi:hypothetical protein